MSVSIRVEGVEQAVRDIAATDLRLRGRMTRAVAKTLLQGETHIKRLISKKGPSAPHTPPGVDTGRLRASYRHRMGLGMSGDVFTEVEYAPHLEYGTRRMAPRPHAGPTAEWMATEFRKNSVEALGG